MGALSILALITALGCQRPLEVEYVSSKETEALEPELQKLVKATLVEFTGTPSSPRLLGAEGDAAERRIELGSAVYAQRCQHCHGVTGDGNGPAAQFLVPRPRDYRRGIFKFTSTPYGAKPRREDLMRTVRRGVVGTSMPEFHLLSDEELEAVVDYVLALTHRGELEVYLAAEADSEGQLDPEVVQEYVETILSAWTEAGSQVVEPLGPMPPRTAETVAQGKALFMTKGCAKCHGEDGRGMTRDNLGVDAWGFSTRAADLTSGMLHGGTQPVDIYRRIYSGINGTPMPSFQSVFAGEPETFWYLVHYVLHVSSQRRQGNLPEFSRPLTLAELASAAQPSAAESTAEPAEESSATEPTETEPTASEPTASEPTVSEPTVSEPAASEPAATEPAATEPATSEPAATESSPAAASPSPDAPPAASASSPPAETAPEPASPPASEPAAEGQP